MTDKAIRNILISFLKTQYAEIRIYQEKSIGEAVCDVMAVTDRLIGFEIKSNRDNYQRLERQIRFYDKFFDENYIVVSQKHITSAENRVPKHWGIIYIVNDGVQIRRKAGKNDWVSRRSQLSVLWKIELKNLLIKNKLPIYAQKEKGYIADKISRQTDKKILGKQIAYELLHRDYSIFGAVDYTVYSKREDFQNIPVVDIIDNLSEKDLEKFTLDKWIDIYRQAKKVHQEKETIYERKVDRAPHKITWKEIEVSLGVPWVDKNIINDFVNYIVWGDREDNFDSFVDYEPVTGAWFINGKRNCVNSNVTVKYGIPRYSALYIIEATLNLREIKLYNKDRKLSEADTLAALEKQKLINEEFKSWVWEDEDRKWQIEEAYNRLFGSYKEQRFDGSNLSFPEMDPEFKLYDYQKDAVARIISSNNTLLAFDVGAGKTYIMIAAAMKMREMGISRKNLFVVPNNIVGQWEKIFSDLYPSAKILTVEPRTFKPEMRRKVLSQMKMGDYDGIIIAYSCLERIPLSKNYIMEDAREKAGEINAVIDAFKAERFERAKINSAAKREIKHIEKLASELIAFSEKNIDEITFDDMEINTVFLDEAHNYKNIPIRTGMKNIRGINIKGSMKCLDMLKKIHCVQKNNNGRGAVFATGTPLCNSISDAYTMQMYLQYDDLRAKRLDRFDNWVKTFAQPEQVCEVDVTAANYRYVTRFVKFFNLPELSLMFSQIAAFYAMDQENGLPDRVDYTNVEIPKSDDLDRYMSKICERAEEIRAGNVDIKTDNMLKVSADGRKAALDLTLVGEQQTYDEFSKLRGCAENVRKIYSRNPNTSQLIFCDYSVPKVKKFNVYAKMKELLVDLGIPKREIAFAHSFKSESSRLKMYDDVNRAKIKVLIGSTFKLGIGANVQSKLKAVHHLDVPWRPADMTQREGRILRRGNENSSVEIFRYITKGSFDSYSWQILENKQRFISQFLTGSSYQRSIEDLENNVLSYAEVKAIALSDPIMKQIAEKESEIKTLQTLINKQAEIRRGLERQKEKLEEEIPRAKERYIRTLNNRDYLRRLNVRQYKAETDKYRQVLTEEYIKSVPYGGKLISFLGFSVFSAKKEDKFFVKLKRNEVSYDLELGNSPSGNIKRISNFLIRFGKAVKAEDEDYQKMQKQYEETKAALALPDNHREEMKKKKEDLAELLRISESGNLIISGSTKL